MNRIRFLLTLLLALLLAPSAAYAFCGFYVAQGDAKIYNQSSRVVIARDGDRTVLTMASDFQGDPREFAVVIPVPVVLKKEQVHIADPGIVDRLHDYSVPRLVEYTDPNPCPEKSKQIVMGEELRALPVDHYRGGLALKAGVITIQAHYKVDEYDILILSAKQSGGLEIWLTENGYSVPQGARRVLASYMRQGMKFFVAKVNLSEQKRLGFSYLRPLQMAYESPKFMLPLRLGMVNADGPQELFVYAITKNGRVETTNYRTVRLPEGMDIPEYVKDDFPRFYRALFTRQVRNENSEAVFLEYAWNMSWCDPCAADPLSADELRGLGVFWLGSPGPQGFAPGGSSNTFITRLHVRYDAAHFPEDLVFQETADQTNFQARYVLRHPWKGDTTCEAYREYRRSVRERRVKEAETLANLTGWDIASIRRKMGGDGSDTGSGPDNPPQWWEQIWSK